VRGDPVSPAASRKGGHAVKTARGVWMGESQVVQLPEEFRIEGDTVCIRQEGDAIVLLPRKRSWQGLLDAVAMVSDDFMEDRNQPKQQERPELDDLAAEDEPPATE
jgi:antitoxin VapB